jgi:hypothetical protein
VLCLISALAVFAQGEMPKSQRFFVHEDVVIPSMVGQYEMAAKNVADLFAKNNLAAFPYTAVSTEDFRYLFFTTVENDAGVSIMDNAFAELEKKIGATASQDAMKAFVGCYESHRNYLIRQFPDLSYKPEYGSQISEGMNFRHWDFYFVHSGKEQEAIAIAKEWKALYAKKSIAEGYRLYMGDLGSDMPLIIVVQSAKDAVDFYSKAAAIQKTLGEESQKLLAKTWSVVRKFDHIDGMIRPDLSYMPTK